MTEPRVQRRVDRLPLDNVALGDGARERGEQPPCGGSGPRPEEARSAAL